MKFSENDDDSEYNYIDESDVEYKLLQIIQTGAALYVNHFTKHSLRNHAEHLITQVILLY